MKILGGLFMLAAMAGLQLTSAQNVTDCFNISIGLATSTMDPVTVPDLPVCEAQRSGPQCCSTQYIQQQQTKVANQFVEGLRIEMRERFEDFNTFVNTLRTYIDGDFVKYYVQSIGKLDFIHGGNKVVNNFINELRDIIDHDDDFKALSATDIQQFLDKVVSYIENAAVQTISGLSNNTNATQCIRGVIESHINVKQMKDQAVALEQIGRISATLAELQNLVRNLTENVTGFRPLQQCIDVVVRLNTCGRCVAVRPPFCENVCEAIASACYSPFNDALKDQLSQLWGVANGIVNITKTEISLLNNQRGLLNVTAIKSQIYTDCQIEVKTSLVRRRSLNNDDDKIPGIPGLVLTVAGLLSGGPFDYSGRDVEGAGFCRLVNTSSSNCWDGMSVIDDDIDMFDGQTVNEQVDNPLLPVIGVSIQNLTDQAASLGTPVGDLITSPAFARVAPAGLVLPNSGTNGASTVLISFATLILMLQAAIFVC